MKKVLIGSSIFLLLLALSVDLDARGRGGGGRGGGGFSRGGGVGFNRGGGGMSRPSTPSFSRPSNRPSTPSFSRPTSRPNSRPSTLPATRPSSRPSVPSNRPSTRPSIPSRPTTRPSIKPDQRPSLPGNSGGNRPGTGNRPGAGNRPGTADRPGFGNRPGGGSLPGLGGNTRPGRDRPGLGERVPNRPDTLDRRPNLNERRDNLGDRLDNRNDRFNNRNDNISDRMDHREDRWHDRNWQHNHWHHGHWHDHHDHWGGGYWWDRYPVMTAFGLTTWAVNRTAWATGYYGYSNPYYVQSNNTYYNYSQPIEVVQTYPETSDDGTAVPPDVPEEARTTFDTALEQFYDGKYQEALDSVNQAVKETPNDAAVHEFRALVLFALGQYDESAATLYAVLSVGPGWDWTTMSGLYPSVDVYTQQLRKLEAYRNEHPQESAPRFVLAYHYLTQGHDDAAESQLKKVIELNPQDTLSKNLLLGLDPDAKVPEAKVVEPPKAESEIQDAQLVGNWTASRDSGEQFKMDLQENGDFTWSYSKGDQSQEVKGVWEVGDDGVLALDMGEDDVMLAQLNLKGNALDFYMLGDTTGAPPLKFTK